MWRIDMCVNRAPTGWNRGLATSWPIAGKISYRSAVFSKRPRPWDPAAGRPSDDQVMDLVRGKLSEIAPEIAAGSRIDHGILLGGEMAGRTPWSIMALPNHTGRPSHFDIGFAPAVNAPDGKVIADCISGIGPLREAVDQMLHIWAETSGACFLEMVAPGGERAFRTAEAIPGWHAIVSGILGYGTDPASSETLRDALAARPVLRETAPTLPWDRNNGIKVYLHKTPTSTTGEVRVNGVPDVAASHALAALPWPEVAAPTTARFYAVAVHRA
jgi:hypothetical protein